MLATKLHALVGFSTDCTEWAKKAHKAFSDWEALIGTLRRTIFDKQGAVPPPPTTPPAQTPPAQPPLAIPKIPTLPAPAEYYMKFVRSATSEDPIWGELPGLVASIRRLYGLVTYNADGIGFPAILESIDGKAYITSLRYRFLDHQSPLVTNRITEIAYTCGIIPILGNLVAVSTPVSL